MDMTELVRAKSPVTGAELTLTRGHAERAGAKILDKQAVDRHGRALPGKQDPLFKPGGAAPAPATDPPTTAGTRKEKK